MQNPAVRNWGQSKSREKGGKSSDKSPKAQVLHANNHGDRLSPWCELSPIKERRLLCCGWTCPRAHPEHSKSTWSGSRATRQVNSTESLA